MITADFQHFDDGGLADYETRMKDMALIKKQMNHMAKSGGLGPIASDPKEGSPSSFIEESLGVTSEDIGKIVKSLLFPEKQCAIGDDDCETKRKQALLGSRYNAAQKKYKQAKAELDQILKEKEDKPAVKKALMQESLAKGEVKAIRLVQEHKALSESIQNSIDLTASQERYQDQTEQIINGFAEDAVVLEQDIADMENRKRVSDRKTYYEVQQINIYKNINWYLLWIYWIIVAVFISALLYNYAMGESDSNGYIQFAYVSFLIAYPFIMDTLIKGVMYVLNILFGRIPDNVYMSP